MFPFSVNHVRKQAAGAANNLILSIVQGCFYVENHLESIYCLLYGVTRYPSWRSFKRTEVYGETIGTRKFVSYIAGVRH